MSAEACIWCASDDVVTTDPDGDGCCARCLPLIDPNGCCGYCGEGEPIKMVGNWPTCMPCLEAFREAGMLTRASGRGQPWLLKSPRSLVAQARALTTKERLEAIACEAGVTGDIWHLSLADFATAVAEARCLKLGLQIDAAASGEKLAKAYARLDDRGVIGNDK